MRLRAAYHAPTTTQAGSNESTTMAEGPSFVPSIQDIQGLKINGPIAASTNFPGEADAFFVAYNLSNGLGPIGNVLDFDGGLLPLGKKPASMIAQLCSRRMHSMHTTQTHPLIFHKHTLSLHICYTYIMWVQ